MNANTIRSACSSRNRIYFNLYSQRNSENNEDNTKSQNTEKKTAPAFWTDEEYVSER